MGYIVILSIIFVTCFYVWKFSKYQGKTFKQNYLTYRRYYEVTRIFFFFNLLPKPWKCRRGPVLPPSSTSGLNCHFFLFFFIRRGQAHKSLPPPPLTPRLGTATSALRQYCPHCSLSVCCCLTHISPACLSYFRQKNIIYIKFWFTLFSLTSTIHTWILLLK